MIVFGDTHLGVQNYGISRTTDIFNSMNRIADTAIDKEEDFVIHLGDFYHNDYPSPELIAMGINWCYRLENAGIRTYILEGNHDKKGKNSALNPIKEIDFEYIKVVSSPFIDKSQEYNMLFLPHVTKAQVIDVNKEKIEKETDREKIKKLKSIDNYLNEVARTMLDSINNDTPAFVFSHLNVEGAVVGTEEFMLKGQHEVLPEVLVKSKKIKYIFNGHMHKKQIIKNKILIPGSVEKFDFGERGDEKTFIEVDLESILEMGR